MKSNRKEYEQTAPATAQRGESTGITSAARRHRERRERRESGAAARGTSACLDRSINQDKKQESNMRVGRGK